MDNGFLNYGDDYLNLADILKNLTSRVNHELFEENPNWKNIYRLSEELEGLLVEA